MNRLLSFLLTLTLSIPVFAQDANPAAEGFDLAGSDAKAIELADAVMETMGGRENWDNTRYLSWSFFADDQVWDKWTGDFRYQKEDLVVLMNVNSMEGKVYMAGEEVTEAAEVEKQIASAYRGWVNSGYWLIMPYKLKDSGVTLKYVGEGTLINGKPAEMLELTFKEVGLTPQNKYHIYVGKETMLVEEWAYYQSADDAEPRWNRPWTNWKQYGDIMLSDKRGPLEEGKEFELPNVGVYESLPADIFSNPARVDISEL